MPISVNPIVASVNSATRTWRDTNGNFVPDCDLAERRANGECGALSNVNFGRNIVTTTLRPGRPEGMGQAAVRLGGPGRDPARAAAAACR